MVVAVLQRYVLPRISVGPSAPAFGPPAIGPSVPAFEPPAIGPSVPAFGPPVLLFMGSPRAFAYRGGCQTSHNTNAVKDVKSNSGAMEGKEK